MRFGWATDIHLNFLNAAARRGFLESIREQVDALLISGDIGESNSIGEMLREIDACLGRRVYFVLGNHDCYRGSVAGTRASVSESVGSSKNLVYLSQAGVVELTPSVALVGHDGWADGRLGDYDGSEVVVNDFHLVDELRCWLGPHTLDKPALRRAIAALGDEAAAYLHGVLSPAADRYSRVIVVTHVPPFREAARYQGRVSSDDHLPFFACQAVGNALLKVADSHPTCELVVLCGHTHEGAELSVRENLQVLTGRAEYGKPELQRIFEIQ